MKPVRKLFDVLKPPFKHDGVPGVGDGWIFDGNTKLLDIRGWGFFQYYENGEALQDEFKEWVTAALNEKYERDRKKEK